MRGPSRSAQPVAGPYLDELEPAFHWFEVADFDGHGDVDVFVYNQKGSTKFESSLWFNQE